MVKNTTQKNILKTGCCSIIMGSDHYSGFFPEKNNKLLKVTKIKDKHNEFTHLHIVRTIENYDKYYIIPDDEIINIKPNDEFYFYMINLTIRNDINIFDGLLQCTYIDYGGQLDLIDYIGKMKYTSDKGIWNSLSSIIKFSKHIMLGLHYLHEKKICHLDIKPENIMINAENKTYKIIDFGFASAEPFDDYVNHIRGTPGYFPKKFKSKNNEESIDHIEGLPEINANDFIKEKDFPMKSNRKLVYKIDSYCLGRVINLLLYYYKTLSNPLCLLFYTEYYNQKKINKLIKLLTEDDVNKRNTITEILEMNII